MTANRQPELVAPPITPMEAQIAALALAIAALAVQIAASDRFSK